MKKQTAETLAFELKAPPTAGCGYGVVGGGLGSTSQHIEGPPVLLGQQN